MAEIRFNYGDKFTQPVDNNVGIGSTIPSAKLDISGGVASTNNASASNEPALIRSLFYDQTANKTYLLVNAFADIFSTNDTLFFSDSQFLSSGTFFDPQQGFYSEVKIRTPIDADSEYVSNQTVSGSNNGVDDILIPFSLSFGSKYDPHSQVAIAT